MMQGAPLLPGFAPAHGAVFSSDRQYRYRLWRVWDESLPLCLFVMLNPSTADASKNDPTVRRCIGFARSWGYGGLLVGNLFALRSTDPSVLYQAEYPVGSDNDGALFDMARQAGLVIAAWGTHGKHLDRGAEVIANRPSALYHLGLTAGGYPRHPLYVPSATRPVLLKE